MAKGHTSKRKSLGAGSSEGAKPKKKKSLADQLSDVFTPKPSEDPEDDHADFAQVEHVEGFEEDTDAGMGNAGRLRMQANLDLEDGRYAGQVKKWEKDDDDDDEEEEEQWEEGEGSEGEGFAGVSDEDMMGGGAGGEDSAEGDSEEGDSDEGDISGEDEQQEDPEDEMEREMAALRAEEKQALEGITAVDDEEIEQGKAVVEQKQIWEDLLELRIIVQKTLAAANRFPKPKDHVALSEHSDESHEELRRCQAAAMAATRDLRGAEAEMVASNEEASEGCGSFGAGALDSDADDEGDPTEEDVDCLWKLLNQDSEEHRPYGEAVITKWGRKAQLSRNVSMGTNFKAFNKGVMEQIGEVLADRPRLAKRTQLRRSQYEIIGESSAAATEARDQHLERFDEEIFDDSDFYSKLLRELIDSGTKNSVEAAMAGRDFLKKSKRQVDTKASKGRKLRYDVHSKLVNFMPAVGLSLPPGADELFANLFGTLQ